MKLRIILTWILLLHKHFMLSIFPFIVLYVYTLRLLLQSTALRSSFITHFELNFPQVWICWFIHQQLSQISNVTPVQCLIQCSYIHYSFAFFCTSYTAFIKTTLECLKYRESICSIMHTTFYFHLIFCYVLKNPNIMKEIYIMKNNI